MNNRSAELAREIFDLTVCAKTLGELKSTGEQFSVISSVAVVEHIPEPLKFLQSCFDIIEPGGCLVTIIPHFTHLNSHVSGGSSANVVPPYHVSLFNEPALRALADRVTGAARTSIEQSGDAAFQLIQHADYGDFWDITIPTDSNKTPRSLQIKNYSSEMSQAMNILSEADSKIGNYFASADGKIYLISYIWKEC